MPRSPEYQSSIEENLIRDYSKRLQKDFRQLEEDKKYHGYYKIQSLDSLEGHLIYLLKFINHYSVLDLIRRTDEAP
jgi:hypothetical protein